MALWRATAILTAKTSCPPSTNFHPVVYGCLSLRKYALEHIPEQKLQVASVCSAITPIRELTTCLLLRAALEHCSAKMEQTIDTTT